MLYGYTHMATVGVKGLKQSELMDGSHSLSGREIDGDSVCACGGGRWDRAYLRVVSHDDVQFAEALKCDAIAPQSLVCERQVVERFDTRRVRLYGFTVTLARLLDVSPRQQQVALVDERRRVVPVCLHCLLSIAVRQPDCHL